MLIKGRFSKASFVKNETQANLFSQSVAIRVVVLVLSPLLIAGCGSSDPVPVPKKANGKVTIIKREQAEKLRRKRTNLTTTSFRTATVAINVEFPDWKKSGTQRLETKEVSQATGIMLDNGLVLTCRHVVDQSFNTLNEAYSLQGVARRIRISYRDKETKAIKSSEAYIVAISIDYDLALLGTADAIPSEIVVGTGQHESKQDDELSAIISPKGLPADELHDLRYGLKKTGNRFTFSNIDVQPTWSGSPIFSQHSPNHGLLGLISIGFKSPRTGGVAVSAEAMRDFLSSSEIDLQSDYIEDQKTINKIELQLSQEAIKLGDGGFFDGLNVRLWLVSGQDKDHCEWRRDFRGNADKSGKLVFNKQCRIPWRSNGVPLRIEVWEEDNKLVSEDDKMDVGMFTSSLPQDAEFPWSGKVRLMKGSTVTFYK